MYGLRGLEKGPNIIIRTYLGHMAGKEDSFCGDLRSECDSFLSFLRPLLQKNLQSTCKFHFNHVVYFVEKNAMLAYEQTLNAPIGVGLQRNVVILCYILPSTQMLVPG